MNTLTKDDVQELAGIVAEVAKKILEVLNTQQVKLSVQVFEHLNKFIDAINNVKTTIEVDTYGMDPSVSLVTLELVPPIKVQIHGGAMETRMRIGAFDDVVKEFSTLQI